jgi:hypothetical protein
MLDGRIHKNRAFRPKPIILLGRRPMQTGRPGNKQLDNSIDAPRYAYDFVDTAPVKSGFGGEQIDSNHRLM